MTHLVIDGDPLIYKAAGVTEKTVYDIVANAAAEVIDKDDPKSYAPYLIATFRYVKEYKEWLNKHGKTKDDFIRVDRKEVEPLSHALNIINGMMAELIKAVEPEQVTLLLSGDTNFRNDIAKVRPYKEARRSRPKPLYFQDIKDFMVRRWRAKVVEGCEADDVCAMIMHASVDEGNPAVLASIDKDLDQVPGMHYNYDKKEFYQVTAAEAQRFFYCQILAGDDTDSVPGIYKVGIPTANKLLGRATTERTMWRTVLTEYAKAKEYKDCGRPFKEIAIEMARLVWMQRHWGELWQPPV